MSTRMTRGAAIKQAALIASHKENKIPELFNTPQTSAPQQARSSAKKPDAQGITPKEEVPKVKAKSNTTTSVTAPMSANKSIITAKKDQMTKKRTVANKTSIADTSDKKTELRTKPGKKRKKPTSSNDSDDHMELPHNMGRVQRSQGLKAENEEAEMLGHVPKERATKGLAVKNEEVENNENAPGSIGRARRSPAKFETTAVQKTKNGRGAQDAINRLAALKAKLAKEAAGAAEYAADTSPKKKSKKDPYGLTQGVTPFPNWSRPTAEECQEVHDILWHRHKNEVSPQPKTIPPPSEFVAGCGEVRSILDALIRTKLGASTTFDHANAAYRGMVARYGIIQSGVGKGSCDYNAVRQAPVEELYDAIGGGGLGSLKSAEIKAILDLVYEENQHSRKESVTVQEASNALATLKGPESGNAASEFSEIDPTEDGNLSLDHYYTLSTGDAMRKFRTYPGIGVKTAACVALFCLQRPCFAVDTHVFRLCQWLGWTPPPDQRVKGQKAVNRDTMFSHLEVRVPDHLKYMLHQLFLAHGKACPKCKATEGKYVEDLGEVCVIEHLVKRMRVKARKGDLGPVKAKKAHSPAKKDGRKGKSKTEEAGELEGFSQLGEGEEDGSGPQTRRESYQSIRG
ncbi:MAG: hypothetical protein ASARMPRED_007444 [Alectoria sarmentosa]|nr:MAG: hypothetical protein ASARMPRED_007444 [Alectoria sarmentosa]